MKTRSGASTARAGTLALFTRWRSSPTESSRSASERTISSALREHNVAVVPGLIKLLAAQDPHRAQDVLDTIEMARIVRSEEARR